MKWCVKTMGFWLLGLVTGRRFGWREFLDCQDFARDFIVIEIECIIPVLFFCVEKKAACPFNKTHDLGMTNG